MTPQKTAINFDALDAVVLSERLPFAKDVMAENRYSYFADPAWRRADYKRMDRICALVGIQTEGDLIAHLERVTWSKRFLLRFAAEAGFSKIDSDRSYLWAMVLVASVADRLTVDQLVSFGWQPNIADTVLSLGRQFTTQAYIH